MERLGAVVVAVLLVTSMVAHVTISSAGATTPSQVETADRPNEGGIDPGRDSGQAARQESRETSSADVARSRQRTNQTDRGNTGHEPWYLYFRDVNTANGNLFRSEEDISIGARGGDISFTRSYNSNLSARHGPLGFGWTHNYDMHLWERPDDSVVFFDADGSTHTFAPTGDGYEAPPGIHSRLARNGSGHVLRRKTGHALVFDSEGTLQRITDKNGNSIHLEYTGDELTAIRDDSGQELTLTYNGEGRISEVTDPLGRMVEYRYDAGDLVEVTGVAGDSFRYSYYENHKMQRADAPSGVPVVYTYHTGSDRVRCVGADSAQASNTCAEAGYIFEYDYANDSVAVVNGLTGNTTSIGLNPAGNPVSVDAPDGNAEMAWDEDMNRVMARNDTGTYRFEYDAYGNPVRKTDNMGNTVNMSWETTATSDTYISLLVNRTGPRGYTTEYRYDEAGSLIGVTNPRGETRQLRYDQFGNRISETDFAGHTTRYTYDEHGFRTAVIDPTGAATNYTYDAAGRMISRTDPRGNTERFERNARGDVVTVVDPTGNATEYDYHPDGRLRRAITPTGREIPAGAPWSPSPSEDTTFERGDRSVTVRTDEYTLTRRFDARDRPVSVTVDFGSFTRRLNYTYESGNLVAVRTAGGTTRYAYDELDRITRIEGPNGTWVNYTYSAADRRTKAVYSNGVTTHYEYNAAGQVLAIRAEHPNGSTLLDYSYTYDAAGNRLTATDTDGETRRYRYDALDRLVGVTYPSGETVEYTYDAVGHRLSRTVNGSRTTTYSYNQEGELETVHAPGGNTTYQYDVDGALVEKRAGSDTTSYDYGRAGRLRSVSPPDGDRVSFTYLPGGERLSKTADGETTYYLYSFFDVVAAFHDDGSLARQYLHGPGIDEPVSLVEDGEAYYYHQDGPTNVRALTDESGQVVNRYRYSPFGDLESASETVANPYQYTGRRYDAESDLYYNRHRYYDPETGRFTKRDPAGVSAGINLYGYADSNPINYRDPSGLDVWTGLLEGGGGMAVVVGGGIYSGQLTNGDQVCSVNIYNIKIGGGLGIAGGIQGTVQSGPACGKNLGGSSWSAYVAAAGGPAMGSATVSTQGGGGASASGGGGTSGGATLEGGAVYGTVTVNGCTCNCDCDPSPYCDEDECDDNDDNPDDNHDLSVMTYDRQYPGGRGPPEFSYQGASVAVLTRGFSAELNDFLASIDETPASVGFRTSQERLDRFDVLVVPTGGFTGISSLSSLERKLGRYVDQGGTLVVMPQQHGYDLEPVPGDLAGFGWREDQSCQYRSVGVNTYCSVLASQDDAVADINVDGYFTDYPENATVLLTRTKNGEPAMLKYQYGEGRVLATAAYTDWAFGHHASHPEGRALLRDVIRWAKQPGNASTYAPGEQVTLSVNVTSYVETSADGIDVRLVDPSGDTQRTVSLLDGLSAFDSRNVTFTTAVPESADRGLWSVEYSLVNDSHGVVQRGSRSGQFAVSTLQESGEGWTYQRSNLSFTVTSSTEHFARGSNASFGITVFNRGDEAENVTVWWSFPHNYLEKEDPMYGAPGTTRPGHESTLNQTLEVPADGKQTITYQVPVYSGFDRLWAEFYRGNTSSKDKLGRASKGFFTIRPSVDLDTETAEAEYTPGDRVTLNLTVRDGNGLSSDVDVRVLDPENRLVYDEQVNVSPDSNGVDERSLEFTLPSLASGGHYTVVADSRRNGERLGYDVTQFVVPSPIPGITPSVPATVRNDSHVNFTVENLGQRNLSNATLSVSLTDPAGTTVWNDSAPVDVKPGESQQFAFRVRRGALSFGTYRLRYTLEYGNGSRASRVIGLPNELTADVDFDHPAYDAGETANATVTITNDGRFPGSQQARVVIPGAGLDDTRQLELAPGEDATLGYTVSLPETISGGQHGTVSLEMANTSTRELGLFVRPSELSLSTPDSQYDAGDSIPLNLTNQGGAITTANCSVTLYGPQSKPVFENRSRSELGQDETVTLAADLPGEATGGAYFVSATCANENRSTGADLLTSVPVSGLEANVSSTTDETAYTAGENVNITTTVTNLNGAIRNGTLTVRIINATARNASSVSDPTSGLTATSTNTADTADNSSDSGLREEDRNNTRPARDANRSINDRQEERNGTGTNWSRRRGAPEPTDLNRTDDRDTLDDRQEIGGSDGLADTQDANRITAGEIAPMGTGDNRTIENETVWADSRKVLNRSVVVAASGNLTLRNVTLVFNNSAHGQNGLEVSPGGKLHVLEGSNVTTRDDGNHSYFIVGEDTTFELRNSTVTQVGYFQNYDVTNRSGLYIDTDGATIENATITDGYYGLVLNASNSSSIRETSVSGYEEDGVYVRASNDTRLEGNDLSEPDRYGDYGLHLRSSNHTTVAGNTFLGNDGFFAYRSNHTAVVDNNVPQDGTIKLDASDLSTVVDNTLAGDYGAIRLVEISDTFVANNTLSGDGADINLYPAADSNTIANNSLTGSDAVIDIDGSANDVRNNTLPDGAIELDLAHHNDVVDNDIGRRGIDLDGSDFNTIRDNTLVNDSDYSNGLRLDHSHNNTVIGNEIDIRGDYGIYLDGSRNTTVRNNAINGSDQHDFFVAGDVYSYDDGGKLETYLNDIENNTVTDGPLYYWVNRSDEQVPADAGAVWLVNSADVTVANGSTVALVYTENATVRDVTVEGGWYGVYLFRSNHTTVTDTTATDNGEGIFLQATRGNTIVDNNVSGNGNGIALWDDANSTTVTDNEISDRLDLYYSSHNTIARNNVTDTHIRLDDAYFNDIRNNTLRRDSGFGSEITLSYDADHNNVTENRLAGKGSGIVLDNADSNLVSNNTFSDGSNGIEIDESSSNTITGNDLVDLLDYHAIEMRDDYDGSNRNTITHNRIHNITTQYYGAYLDRKGIEIQGGSNSLVRDNNISEVSQGITLGDSWREFPDENVNDTRIVDNNISEASGTAIRLDTTENTTLAGNTVTGSDGYGIAISYSVGVTMRNNTFRRTEATLFVSLNSKWDELHHAEHRYYRHDIDTSNTFDGEPLYYLVNASDRAISEDAAAVWAVESTNVTVTNDIPVGLVHTTDSTVRNVDHNGSYRPIYVRGGSNHTIADSTVTNSSYGARIEAARDVTLRNVTFTDNEWGVYFYKSDDSTLEDSNVSLNHGAGVWLEDTNTTTVRDNQVRNSTDYGIGFNDTFATNDANRVVNNTIIGTRYIDGIYISSANDTTIAANTIAYNDGWGLDLYGVDNGTIANNTIAYNDAGGIALSTESSWRGHDSSDDNLIYNNVFRHPDYPQNADDRGTGNRWNVTKRPGENIVGGPFLAGNYWGDYGGVDLDGDSLGNTKLPYNASGDIESGGDYHPLIIKEPPGPVVWSTNVTVNVSADTTESLQFTVPAGTLSDVTGKLKLTSTLSSRINQTIAEEDPAFYRIDGDTIVTLETDKPVYKPNESVVISGVVENTGSSEETYTLSVERNGTEITTRTLTLAPGENDTYSVTTRSEGTFTATATAGDVTVEDRVQVSAPSVDATVVAPDVVGREPFTAGVRLENTGEVPATLNVTIANGSRRNVTLAPGASTLLERSLRIDANTTLAVNLTGDVDETLEKTVAFGERVDLTVTPEPGYTPGTVAVPYTVENTGRLETSFNLTLGLDGHTVEKEIYLSPGGNTSGSLRTNLTAGNYTLTYSTSVGANGTEPVRVAERNQIALETTTGNVTDDNRLPVNVTVKNTGPNDVYATLRANSTVFATSREVNVSAGETRTLSIAITVPEGMPAGRYTLSLEAATEGAVVATHADRFAVTAPHFEVVAAPSNASFRVGERATLNFTVENTGGAGGRGRVNVTIPGIHQAQPTVWLDPDEQTNLTVPFLVPEDLQTGRYDLEYGANGKRTTTGLFVEGLNASATATLDEPAYDAGETATLTLDVTNPQSRNLSLFSRVKFNDYDRVKNYTLAGGETTTLTFRVPIEFGGDEKIFYSVYAESGRSLYINGLRPHRNRSENVTLYTDEPVYDVGETATIRLQAHDTGEFAVSAPGFVWQETLTAGATRNLSFTVPELKSGTHYVHYSFGNRSHSYAFDVDGYHVRVYETTFGKERHTAGEDANLTVTVAPNRNVSTTVTTRIYDSRNRLVSQSRQNATLRAGEDTLVLTGSLPANASGIHTFAYRIDADLMPSFQLVEGRQYFEVESAASETTCISGAVAGDDGRIGLNEIQQAINWWAEDAVVPDTAGETISLSGIQRLIDAWARNRTVSC